MLKVHYLVNILSQLKVTVLWVVLWLCTLQAGLAFQTQGKVAIGLDGVFSAAIFTGLKTIKQESKLDFCFSGISFQQVCFAGIFFQQVCFSGIFFQKYPQVGRMKNRQKSCNKFFFRQFFFQVFSFSGNFGICRFYKQRNRMYF